MSKLASAPHRHGAVTMSLLWVTMVASFPAVIIGFDWYKQGLSFNQVLMSLILSIGILILYSIPICTIAIKSGLSFKQLLAELFGPVLTRNLTVCLIVLYLGWYAVCALLMADAFCGFTGSKAYMPALAFTFCFAMAFNNFFGFKGVANFARFVGAPAVILWVVYMFTKMAPQMPDALTHSHDTVAPLFAFCVVSQFVVGFAIWGNEADYWRNGKCSKKGTIFALLAALSVGQLIFPLTGWLAAAHSGITDSAQATAYLNNFTFGKAAILALLFVAAQYFAVNDSNLYAFTHAVESFTTMSHRKVVTLIALFAGLLAVVLTLSGTASALESMCSLNSVLLPTATILIVVEWGLFRRGRMMRRQSDRVRVSRAELSAMTAWSVGAAVGILTSGIIPGTKPLHVGIPALQAWFVAVAVYIPMRRAELAAFVRRRAASNIVPFPVVSSAQEA